MMTIMMAMDNNEYDRDADVNHDDDDGLTDDDDDTDDDSDDE